MCKHLKARVAPVHLLWEKTTTYSLPDGHLKQILQCGSTTGSCLQIRLTDGKGLTQNFKAKETLAAVRVYIQMNRTDGNGPFSLMTSYPRKVFTEDDMDLPLKELGKYARDWRWDGGVC